MLRALLVVVLVSVAFLGLISRLFGLFRLPVRRPGNDSHVRVVRCAVCDVFVPENEAVYRDGHTYCSEAHMLEASGRDK